MNQLCKVCGEPAAGFHFGAFTCEGCKSFFGRTYNNVSGVSECKNGNRCEITKKNRTSCKSCRLRKCLSVGMSKSGSRYGRRSNWFKIHCLLSAQSQNGLSSLPETNNNSSAVTNNNNTNSSNSTSGSHPHHHPKSLPSTITSGHGHSESDLDRDRDRSRTSSSSHARLGNGTGPMPFPHLASLSPDSKERFMSSLNRKMANPDLYDYFRAANLGFPPGLGPKPFYADEGAEDMSRTTQSPGSLESPNSEASAEESKANIPLFGLPPGSPHEMKPNELLSFDLLTRDLMKLGYDPLRLWPAMLSSPQSLHGFNPYRFMFPNFPAGAAGPFPGGIPNGMLGAGPPPAATLIPSAKLIPAPESLSQVLPHTNRRFPLVVPPLTPPISHHGAEEPAAAVPKFGKLPVQDQPIDLSAKSSPGPLIRIKGEVLSEPDDEDSSSDDSFHSAPIRKSRKSSCPQPERLRNSDQENDEHCDGDDESEDSFSCGRRRSASSRPSSPLPKKVKASTPLDLTRSTNSNPPPAKIAT